MHDLTMIPPGFAYEVRFCGQCPHGHVIVLSEEGIPICQFVISAVQADRIGDTIRDNDPNFKETHSA